MKSNAYKNYVEVEREFALMVSIVFVLVCIFIGWLVPIPSPFEHGKVHIPEEQISKAKVSSKVAPPMPKKEVLIDLNEDGEPEWYVIAPLEVFTGNE